MDKLLMALIKGILGMKFGYLILIGIAIILGLSIIKNIFSGSFNIAKFASGFNPFTGSMQGKLIWLAIWAFIFFTAYQFIMRPTYSYDTDYKNQIHHNEDVLVDQRVGATCIPTKILWGLIQIGCNSSAMEKNITNNCKDCAKPDPKTNIIPRGK